MIMENIHKFLEDKIEIRCNTAVEEICRQEDGTFVLELNKGEKVACKYLIAAPGRAGAEWYTEQCAKMGLDFINNQVDIGVRVEVPAEVFKHITDEVYEAKILYRTSLYNDVVRTFCMNPTAMWLRKTRTALLRLTATATATPKCTARTPTLRFW